MLVAILVLPINMAIDSQETLTVEWTTVKTVKVFPLESVAAYM